MKLTKAEKFAIFYALLHTQAGQRVKELEEEIEYLKDKESFHAKFSDEVIEDLKGKIAALESQLKPLNDSQKLEEVDELKKVIKEGESATVTYGGLALFIYDAGWRKALASTEKGGTK